jgi:DNA-binding LacI/PurR family transcriptional regulator
VSQETREKVLAAAAELGYSASPIATSLVTGRTKNVGVMIPFFARWFFGEVLEGIEARLRAHGYDMTVYNVHPGPRGDEVLGDIIARRRFDGIIIVAIDPDEHDVARLLDTGRPVVGIGGPIPRLATIAVDDVGIARMATEHLLRLGHTDVVHLGGDSSERADFSVPRKRRTGYEEAMAEAGLGERARTLEAEMSIPAGYEAGIDVLSDPRRRPTALFAACDELAVGAIIAARRLGIAVPGELSVIGIDGHECAAMFSLTTIEQAPREQGTAVVDLLLRAIDTGESPDGVTNLPTRLRVRNSTSRLIPAP